MRNLIVCVLICCSSLSTASLIGMCNARDGIHSYDGVRVEFLGQSNQNCYSKEINDFSRYLSEQKDKSLPEILRNLLTNSLNLPAEVKFVCNLSDENITISYLKDNGAQLKDLVRYCQDACFGIEGCFFSIKVLTGELGLMSVEFGDRVFPEEFEIGLGTQINIRSRTEVKVEYFTKGLKLMSRCFMKKIRSNLL